MKVNATVKQPTPEEIINEYFADKDPKFFFVDGSVDCLTDDGKACLAIGITVFKQFKKNHK